MKVVIEDRADRIDPNNSDGRILLFQISADPGDSPSRPHAHYEVRDFAFRVLPDLGPPLPIGLVSLDDADAAFDTAARVQIVAFHVRLALAVTHNAVQPHERRTTDRFEDVVIAHEFTWARRGSFDLTPDTCLQEYRGE